MPPITKPIYLDNHSTTPVDNRVLDAMLPFFTVKFGNASSRSHRYGWEAEIPIENARNKIAGIIGASSKEILFTSGATESNNLALKGVAESYLKKGNHIITATTEHKSIIETLRKLGRKGFDITFLPTRKDGILDPDDLKRAITERTILVSIMFANNEIGSINPIKEIGDLCKRKGLLFHTDATQAIGKVFVNVNEYNIDLLSGSAHKIYGPKGVGFLYVRSKNPKVMISAQINGGGQERGCRSGTLNVPGIVGCGKALEIASKEFKSDFWHYLKLRNELYDKIFSHLDGVLLNGPKIEKIDDLRKQNSAIEASKCLKRLPNNLHLSFNGVKSRNFIEAMGDVAVSSGSACESTLIEPSHVLKALNLDDELIHSSIRFGIGRMNTNEEIDFVANKVLFTVNNLRAIRQR